MHCIGTVYAVVKTSIQLRVNALENYNLYNILLLNIIKNIISFLATDKSFIFL